MREEILLDTRSATIGGQSFFVGEKRDRPLLVAVHGGGFNSKYFEGPFGLPATAAAAGFDTVLLNRPGAPPSLFKRRCADILTDNAEALNEAIEQMWRKDGSNRPGVFLVGHSIGGAVVLLTASRSHSWPLMAISVSGIGDRPPSPPPYSTSLFDSMFSPLLPRPAMALLFMAPGTASEPVLDALEAASTPAVTEELSAIYEIWPKIAEKTLASILAPVQMILAEFEPLWQAGEAGVVRLRALRAGAPTEVMVWPRVGHCIEYHPGADGYHAAVLGFAKAAQSKFGSSDR